MNIYLNCPYSQKDIAKQHGARWDAARKQWFFAGDALPEPLKQFANPPSKNGRAFYRCPSCGTIGYGGAYPFSTCPPNCDDCN